MRVSVFLLASAVLLTACAHPQPTYTKPNATAQQHDSDLAVCLAQAGQASGGNLAATLYGTTRDLCMSGKGWVRQQ